MQVVFFWELAINIRELFTRVQDGVTGKTPLSYENGYKQGLEDIMGISKPIMSNGPNFKSHPKATNIQ